MTITKKRILHLIIAILGVFTVLYLLTLFNRYMLSTFSLPLRMVLLIITQWSLFSVPGILMLFNKKKISDLGFTKSNIIMQIIIGVLLAVCMSLVLTVLPILLGFKDYVGSTSYTHAWQFIYEYFYMIFGVALAEELVFRGYFFSKLLEIKNSKWFAIILSSLLFGLFHVFNGNIIQIIATSLLGLIFCIFREKIKSCTLLSLIITHGMYNAMIIMWVALL